MIGGKKSMKLSEQTRAELSRLITVKEAALKLKKTEGRIRQYISDGLLDSIKLGVLVDPADLKGIILRKRGRKKSKK